MYKIYCPDIFITCMANIELHKQPTEQSISSKLYYSNLCSHGTGKYWKSVRANILCTRFPWTRWLCLLSLLRTRKKWGRWGGEHQKAPIAIDKSTAITVNMRAAVEWARPLQIRMIMKNGNYERRNELLDISWCWISYSLFSVWASLSSIISRLLLLRSYPGLLN